MDDAVHQATDLPVQDPEYTEFSKKQKTLSAHALSIMPKRAQTRRADSGGNRGTFLAAAREYFERVASTMAAWHFFQGFTDEWRWYRLDDAGGVIAECDRGFAELRACMANAEDAGFTAHAFRVHTRQSNGNGAGRLQEMSYPVPVSGERSDGHIA